jgi:hypothetical protein
MEGELWPQVYRLLMEESNKRCCRKYVQFSDGRILEVYLWAVLHDRPTVWACDLSNWPFDQHWRNLPSPPTMSQRLRTVSVRCLMKSILDRLRENRAMESLVKSLDSKPLCVGCFSKDHDAHWGHAAAAKARGYKLFCLWGDRLVPDTWTLGPMNEADSEAGVKLLGELKEAAYILGDAGHDSNRLHEACARCGGQLVAPRKKPKTHLGHRKHRSTRRRSIEMLEWPVMLGTVASPFAKKLYAMRTGIERDYGNLCAFGCGLQPLPSWVRTPHRVAMWVAGKLIINALRKCKNAGLAA